MISPKSGLKLFAQLFRRAALVTILAPCGIRAQEIRGTALYADGATPATSVVAILLHATRDDSIIARAITGSRGTFALKTPAGQKVRLRFLRVGYEPMDAGSFALNAGEVQTVRHLAQLRPHSTRNH